MSTKQKYIKREFYLKQIKKYISSPLVKVITGMRRVGKSFVMKMILDFLVTDQWYNQNQIFYINKELLEFDFIKDYNDLNKHFLEWKVNNIKNEKIIISIDEIQEIQWREKFINSILAEYWEMIDIYITWSNANLLSSKLSTYIAGRYIEFVIYPLNFEEYSIFAGKKPDYDLFLEYIKYWWLPGIFNLKDQDTIYDYLKWVYDTIFVKDILNYNSIKSNTFFEQLYEYIFKNIWSVFTANSIADYLKSQKIDIWVQTVLNYLSYWQASFIIHNAKRYNIRGKKTFQIYDKFFTNDIWLRNAKVGFNFATDIGLVLENIVYNELIRRWNKVLIWRRNDLEVDFVAEKNWNYEYYQVCYILNNEKTTDREFRSLLAIQDNRPKYVISMDQIFPTKNSWIQHINIIDWILWK